jgi:NAD kinase
MGSRPRIVIVTRPTPWDLLLRQHGTVGQAEFYLRSRGEKSDWYRETHEKLDQTLAAVSATLPPDQRRVRVDRDSLDRFLFGPDDVVVVVGQDGLVANVAKYLTGQTTIGINPDPKAYDGVLCRHPASNLGVLLAWVYATNAKAYRYERRTMLVAEREDGQRLLALNEVFIGHQTHQSARYRLHTGTAEERHSSSGVICATGTGSTGWARSIANQRGLSGLPGPEDQHFAWFVREPFPSIATGIALNFGIGDASARLVVRSEMGEGGTIFADGIESDRLEFLSGQTVTVRLADVALNLVVPA